MPGWDTYTEIQGTDVAAEDLLPLSDQSQTDGSRQRVVSRSGLSFALGKFPISETAHGLSVGDAVRFDGTNYVEATADTSANAEMIGLVVEVVDTDTFVLQQVGFVTGLSGLTAGEYYYLQDAGGLGTATGTVAVRVLLARAATTGWLLPLSEDSGAAGSVSAIDDLSDVDTTTTSPSVGDTLRWDGSNWVPTDLEINPQTGTTYTLVAGDAQKLVTLDNGSAITVTIPTNASVAFPVGTTVAFAELGAGTVTISGDTGVTVNGSSGGSESISAQYGTAVATKLATDTWLVAGSLS